MSTSQKAKIDSCHYCYTHERDKSKKRVYPCKYCAEYFCDKHIKPKPPSQPRFKSSGPIAERLMENYRKEDAHPCAPFTSVYERKIFEENERYKRKLGELLNKKQEKYFDEKGNRLEPADVLNRMARANIARSDADFKRIREKEVREILKEKQNEREWGNEGNIDDAHTLAISNAKGRNHGHPTYIKKNNFISNHKGLIFFFLLVIFVLIAWKVGWLNMAYDKLTDLSVGNKFLNSIFPSKYENKTLSETLFNALNTFRKETNISVLQNDPSLYSSAVYVSKLVYENKTLDGKLVTFSIKILHIDANDMPLYVAPRDLIEVLQKKGSIDLRYKEYNSGAVGCYKYVCSLVIENKVESVNPNNIEQANTKSDSLIDKAKKFFTTDLEEYRTGPKEVQLFQVGKFVVYEGVNDYLAGLDRSISYSYVPPTTRDFIMRDLDNEVQRFYLDPLVDKIKSSSDDKTEQARIAILMVQGIPYDWGALSSGYVTGRYPYEVLYDMTGVCMEKADLMAYLLRGLGFGVAIFEYETENHRAVGIKCSNGNYNSQYCFIEPTDYYPVGQIPFNYVGGADIRNAHPEIVVVSDGDYY